MNFLKKKIFCPFVKKLYFCKFKSREKPLFVDSVAQ